MSLEQLTLQSQKFISEVLRPGDPALDATAGNGWDTRWLLDAVGPSGHVWAIDLQSTALETARRNLSDHPAAVQISWIHGDHADLESLIPSDQAPNFRGIVYNLGYLPGGDHSVTTQPSTTIPSIRKALDRLAPEGRLAILAYRGHSGGAEEAAAVSQCLNKLSVKEYHAVHYHLINHPPESPTLFLVEKN